MFGMPLVCQETQISHPRCQEDSLCKQTAPLLLSDCSFLNLVLKVILVVFSKVHEGVSGMWFGQHRVYCRTRIFVNWKGNYNWETRRVEPWSSQTQSWVIEDHVLWWNLRQHVLQWRSLACLKCNLNVAEQPYFTYFSLFTVHLLCKPGNCRR